MPSKPVLSLFTGFTLTYEDFTDRTAWSMLSAFTHIAKERQQRYPNKAAWEVMQFQALLSA